MNYSSPRRLRRRFPSFLICTILVLASGAATAAAPTPGVRFLHHDQRFDTVLVTAADGSAVSRLAYTPYGDAASSSAGDAGTLRRFSSQGRDAASDLDYFHARYYDSDLGRFLSPDPAGEDANRYGLAGDAPTHAVDLDGRRWAWAGMLGAQCGLLSAFGGLVGTLGGMGVGYLIDRRNEDRYREAQLDGAALMNEVVEKMRRGEKIDDSELLRAFGRANTPHPVSWFRVSLGAGAILGASMCIARFVRIAWLSLRARGPSTIVLYNRTPAHWFERTGLRALAELTALEEFGIPLQRLDTHVLPLEDVTDGTTSLAGAVASWNGRLAISTHANNTSFVVGRTAPTGQDLGHTLRQRLIAANAHNQLKCVDLIACQPMRPRNDGQDPSGIALGMALSAGADADIVVRGHTENVHPVLGISGTTGTLRDTLRGLPGIVASGGNARPGFPPGDSSGHGFLAQRFRNGARIP